LVEQAEAQDDAEDQEYGADSDGYSVDEELARREARLAKIRALRERLETEERAEQDLGPEQTPVIGAKEQRSFADGDARMMLLKRGEYAYAYNAHAVVDEGYGVIVAADLTNIAPDEGHLPALAARVRALRDRLGRTDQPPTTVSADAAYFSRDNIAEDGGGLDLLIAAGRDDPAAPTTTDGARFSADRFGYDKTADAWVCPAGRWLRREVTPPGATGRPATNRYRADAATCAACALGPRCLAPGEDRRILVVQKRGRTPGAMRFKMRQPAARRRYARRKAIVEPVFGQVKEDRGFATLSLRGLALAKAEYLLACLAHNLGKLLRVCPLRPRPVGA
jgi:transposase